MTSFIHAFIAVYAALFPIVNPLGAAPIFLSFVRNCSPRTREIMARKVAFYGFLILFCTMLIGAKVMLFFGISLPVLRIAGGMVIAAMGWNLLNKNDQSSKQSEKSLRGVSGSDAGADDEAVLEQAFYPLTLPMAVGPGSIATTIALSAGPAAVVNQNFSLENMTFIMEAAGAFAALAAIGLSIYFTFRSAPVIQRALGRTGTNVLVRLFSFILFTIGLQIIWLGASELIDQVAARLGHS